jgi:hypothetical protein
MPKHSAGNFFECDYLSYEIFRKSKFRRLKIIHFSFSVFEW